MKAAAAAEVSDLVAAVTKAANAEGANLCLTLNKASKLFQLWLSYLEAHKTKHGDFLLDASTCALKETAAFLSLGLARGAMTSMRLQIDLMLGWLYFKDHPIELKSVEITGDGFKLKKELLQYLEIHPKFKTRNGLMLQCRTRKIDDPYRLLSAHIHGQSELVVPKAEHLAEAVFSKQICDQCVDLQFECSEYTSDLLLSLYGDSWAALPPQLAKELDRLNLGQRKAFFS